MTNADLNLPPLLDDEIIAELREVMEDEFIDLIDSFLNDLPVQLKLLQAAVTDKSAADVYRIAHKLKSSCGTIGALRLTHEIQQLELAGRQNALDPAPQLIARAWAAAEETMTGLRALRE